METDSEDHLDAVFSEVGEFGLFQIVAYILICIPCILTSSYDFNYIITANTLDYRCKVPECEFGENNREIPFDQPWLSNAIPYSNGDIDNCLRYAPKNQTDGSNEVCQADLFDTSVRITCSEYVYASDERNVQTEFNIHCADSYKLALVGTVNNIACFLFLPFTGILSDRFGRLTLIVIGIVFASIFGITKSLSVNYIMYIIFEFFEASMGACVFETIYVLGIEWAHSNYHVLGSTIISVSYSIGSILLGLVAMFCHDFRTMLRILYAPGVILFSYFWIVPESVRWLLITGQVDRAVKILKRAAKFNRKELSSKTIEVLYSKYSKTNEVSEKENSKENYKNESFVQIFKSKKLCGRFLICCYQWMACYFCYYGLSLYATFIPGAERYISFILVVAIEVPAIFITQPLLNRMKRRVLLITSLSIASISAIATPFIPEGNTIYVLILFLVGKASMTAVFTMIYIFTVEQWPTNHRNTIMNSCAMAGRVGSMVAPFTAIFNAHHHGLPALLFGSTAILAAVLTIFSPETYSKKLPDTIKEAEHL